MSQFYMSGYDPMWMDPDPDPSISLIAQDEVVTTESVPKEQVPTSSLGANEIAEMVKERLQRAREQREARLLNESRPTDRVLKYTVPQMQSQSTQRTEVKDRRDLEEEQNEDGKGQR
jgi:hypothetical protein